MQERLIASLFLASHVACSLVFGSADPLVVAQLEQLRLDVQSMARAILLQKSEGDLCDWKLWRTDVFLKFTILFDLLLVACLVWWYCTSLPGFQQSQIKQPLALSGFDTSGSSDSPVGALHSADTLGADLRGPLLLATTPAAAKAVGRPGRPSDFGFRPVA